MASYLNAFVPLCPFPSVPLELGLINQEELWILMHEKSRYWSAGKNGSECIIRCLTLNNESTEHAQIFCWVFIAQTVHIHSLICFIGVCVWHVPHPDPLPHSAVNTKQTWQWLSLFILFWWKARGAICGYCFGYNLTWSLMMILVVIKIIVLLGLHSYGLFSSGLMRGSGRLVGWW